MTDWLATAACAIIRRKSDCTLWAASSPQNFGLAMSGLTARKSQWHFVRLREWRGLLIAAPRVFWMPHRGEFELLFNATAFWLPKWSEQVESQKILGPSP